MKIAGIQKESFIDYSGKVSVVVFTAGCNYRCPSCHAKTLVDGEGQFKESLILDYLKNRKSINAWIDGLVLCGGEPTLQKDLIPFIKKIKEKDFLIKLDTNGSNYKVLEELFNQKLIDYVALDVKAPISLYPNVIGRKEFDINNFKKSIQLVAKFPDYEFRTTIIPIERGNKISFMTVKEAEEIAKFICSITKSEKHKYFLQRFVSRNSDEMIDRRFGKENLQKKLQETPEKLLKEMQQKILPYLPNCEVR